jgi:predicted transcriptional regulator
MATSWNPEIQRTNRLFDALGTEWRRRVLLLVRDGEPHELTELTAHEARGDEIRLVHVDLPKLARGGYLTWDRETGALARGPQFGDVEPFLEVLHGRRAETAADGGHDDTS